MDHWFREGRAARALHRSRDASCTIGLSAVGPEWKEAYVVVLHHLAQYIEGIGCGKMGVGRCDEGGQFDCPMVSKHLLQSDLQRYVVLVEISKELLSA